VVAAEGHDHAAGIFKDIGADETLRATDQRLDFICAKRGHPAERVNAGKKTDFRLEDIAHAGQDFLMKQYIAHFFMEVREQALCSGG
jgi:hypothetical protein